MAESEPGPAPARAVVSEKRGISIVWLVPVVAALIGAWLAYTAISERGPEVFITFETAEGLEAGKTKIRFKNVDIGVVESIDLLDDLSGVEVMARLSNDTEPYLTDASRFWVERARVTAGQVTGLGTILSGAFIAMEPSSDGESTRRFTGLEVPPIVTSDKEGTHFTLRSDTLGSIEVGSPVYFRRVEVGRVVASELDESGDFVTFQVFIKSPHNQRVRQSTKFWNASGIDVTLGADGLRVDTVSLTSLLIGGIAFDTPPEGATAELAEPGRLFTLYASKTETTKPKYTGQYLFRLYFSQSVGGLSVGAPVEYLGIKIGEVRSIETDFDELVDPDVPILIEIQPDRINTEGMLGDDLTARWSLMVEKGMRAQLVSGNLLTGALSVAMDFFPDAEPAELRIEDGIPVIPTIPSPVEQLTAGLTGFMKRLDTLPIEKIGGDLEASLSEVRSLVTTLDEDVAPRLAATLETAERALASTDALIAPDSELNHDLKRLLNELAATANSLRLLAEYLEQHPESLIRGRGDR